MPALALRLAGGTDTAQAEPDADARLLAAAAGGDQSAFARLVERHYPVVYRVVQRMMGGHADAEDVTQEAFLRLWRNPTQLREAGATRGWLVRVASNLAMDAYRKKRPANLDEAADVVDGAAGGEQRLDQNSVAARMDQAIAALPERQRLALTLVQHEHMSNAAAAQVLEISVEALESLLARARRALKQNLAGEWRTMLAALAGEG
jgi:RNA polymerase sigma-70 factor, ECF subfamily